MGHWGKGLLSFIGCKAGGILHHHLTQWVSSWAGSSRGASWVENGDTGQLLREEEQLGRGGWVRVVGSCRGGRSKDIPWLLV